MFNVLPMIEFIISRFAVLLSMLKDIIIVRWNDLNITFLGFIGALIIIGIAIRLLLPKS